MATRFQQGSIITPATPTGTVLAYGGSAAPSGWLLCNGSAVSRTTYAALFAAISTFHGSGDGSTTFNLPDYRGRILRGRDGGIARDPDRASRTAANSGGNTGDNVGSVQGEATKKNGLTASGTVDKSQWNSDQSAHTHGPAAGNNYIYGYSSGGPWNVPTTGAPAFSGGPAGATGSGSASWSSVNANATVTIGTGDNETRPINAYVNYIIKL